MIFYDEPRIIINGASWCHFRLFLVERNNWSPAVGSFPFLSHNYALKIHQYTTNNILTLTRRIGLPPHTPVAQKIADQR